MAGDSEQRNKPGIRGTPSESGEARRARILGEARRHFLSLGFARFSMDDLAAELGMSKKTLYRHFRSKHAVVDALIDVKAAEIKAGFEAILGRTGISFFERVGLVFQHLHLQVGEIGVAFLRDLRRLAPGSFERLEAVRSEILPGVWRRLLDEGIDTGAVRPDTDVAQTAQLILVAIEALLRPENLDRLRLAPHQAAENFFDMIFAGLLTQQGRESYEKNRPEF